MAVVQYGSLVTELKGSVGGQTFQSTRSGFSVRNKPLPRNPRAPIQQSLRSIIQYLSQHWRGLSDGERLSWDVQGPNWPAVDKFGNPKVLSGYEIYIRANSGLILIGESPTDSGVAPDVLYTMTDPEMVIAEGTSTASLTWSSGAVSAGTTVVLYLSGPLSAGRGFSMSYVSIKDFIGVGATAPYSFAVPLTDKTGLMPPPGSRIWAAVQSVSMTSGNRGLIIPFSTIVTA